MCIRDRLDSYRNDHSKMVVQLAQPCLATYRRRSPSNVAVEGADTPATEPSGATAEAPSTRSEGWSITVDRELCQGHGVCENEAPDLFSVSKKGELTIGDQRPPEEARAAAEAAVRFCPTHALSIRDE